MNSGWRMLRLFLLFTVFVTRVSKNRINYRKFLIYVIKLLPLIVIDFNIIENILSSPTACRENDFCSKDAAKLRLTLDYLPLLSVWFGYP